MYLGLRNYTDNLLRYGFTEDDIADGGSDRLIDTIVPHGTAEEIVAAAREHLDAGRRSRVPAAGGRRAACRAHSGPRWRPPPASADPVA